METELLLDKNQIIDSFKNLPDKVSSEDLIERIREAATSPGTSHEDLYGNLSSRKEISCHEFDLE